MRAVALTLGMLMGLGCFAAALAYVWYVAFYVELHTWMDVWFSLSGFIFFGCVLVRIGKMAVVENGRGLADLWKSSSGRRHLPKAWVVQG